MGKDDFRVNVFNPQVLTMSPELEHLKEGCLTWPVCSYLFVDKFCVVSYHDENGRIKK